MMKKPNFSSADKNEISCPNFDICRKCGEGDSIECNQYEKDDIVIVVRTQADYDACLELSPVGEALLESFHNLVRSCVMLNRERRWNATVDWLESHQDNVYIGRSNCPYYAEHLLSLTCMEQPPVSNEEEKTAD